MVPGGWATVVLWVVPETLAVDQGGGTRLQEFCGRRRWLRCSLRAGGRARGQLGYVPGEVAANGAPSVALEHAARDEVCGPEAGSNTYGSGSTGIPYTAYGREVHKTMTTRAVASSAISTTRLSQIICSGGQASMQRAAMQGYVGAATNNFIQRPWHVGWLDDLEFLAFTPRDKTGINRPQAEPPSFWGTRSYAIVTIASHELRQDGVYPHVARAFLDALRRAFSAEDTIIKGHVMEHGTVSDRSVN